MSDNLHCEPTFINAGDDLLPLSELNDSWVAITDSDCTTGQMSRTSSNTSQAKDLTIVECAALTPPKLSQGVSRCSPKSSATHVTVDSDCSSSIESASVELLRIQIKEASAQANTSTGICLKSMTAAYSGRILQPPPLKSANNDWILEYSSRPEAIPPSHLQNWQYMVKQSGCLETQSVHNLSNVQVPPITPPNSPAPERSRSYGFSLRHCSVVESGFFRADVLSALFLSNFVSFLLGAGIAVYMIKRKWMSAV